MRILGIESSCDETAAAVLAGEAEQWLAGAGSIRSNVVVSQLEVHAEFGGVVPELASRAHIRNVVPVVGDALRTADIGAADLDAIAVTSGPGLIGGLLVGLSVAKGLALALNRPLIGVHHMEGHLMSPLLAVGAKIDFPFVALLVSGGHTLLLQVRGFEDYQLLGQTRDDAVGEAFDKGARMLGLGYPGGPALAALAEGGDPEAVAFPRVLLDRKRFDFSFSGLKTALRTHLHRTFAGGMVPAGDPRLPDVAASYQEALVETLAIKALAACRKVGCSRLLVAGGVGANQRLRAILAQRAAGGVAIHFPPLSLCTDNGAMIALAGLLRLDRLRRAGTDPMVANWTLNARPRWPVTDICTPLREEVIV